MFQAVPGRLPVEAPQIGAQHGEIGPAEFRETRHRRQVGGQPAFGAGAVQDAQFAHGVGGAAPRDGARSAGVVADHAAERAAILGRRVRPEAQPVRTSRPLQLRQHHARLHGGHARGRIDRHDPVHMPAEVEDESGTDRIARHRRSRTACGHRQAVIAGEFQGDRDVLVGAGKDDRGRRNPIVRRVRGVLRPPPLGGIDLTRDRAAQRRHPVHSVDFPSARGAGCSRPLWLASE
jgi:hypothetical protein